MAATLGLGDYNGVVLSYLSLSPFMVLSACRTFKLVSSCKP